MEHAKSHPTRRLVELGQRIHDHLDPDGPTPSEQENEKKTAPRTVPTHRA
ncbi:hypothetical protein [Fodinicola feengrottensis]|nr:hypothetical protein [Fodinicola feengrottensis]